MKIQFDLLKELKFQLDSLLPEPPRFGLILGTGLANLSDKLEDKIRIPYNNFKIFPVPTAPSHDDAFYFGYLNGAAVLMMGGRFHYYEGYSMQQITLPVRLMCMYELKCLWLSNAAGSVNAGMKAGDLVFIRDHINMMPENPLRGRNDERLGLRFPDMLRTYNREWNKMAMKIGEESGIRVHEGVYFAWQGPNLETPAEYEMIHRLGGDVVGMSTVPEVLVARHMNTPVIVSSIVSNVCYPLEAIRETMVEDVIKVVQRATPHLEKVVLAMIGKLK